MRLILGRRRWMVALSAGVLALAGLAGVAVAVTTSTLSFEVKGEYAKLKRTACHKTKPNWRAFHKSSTMEFRGFLLPPPASHFQVDVRVEKCVRGHWKEVRNYYLVGENATDSHPGRYKAFYPAKPLAPRRRHHHRTVAYYRAKAYVGSVRSQEKYFFVGSG